MSLIRHSAVAAAMVLALGTDIGTARADVVYEVQQVSFSTLSFDATIDLPTFIDSDVTFPIADFTVNVNEDNFFNSVEFSPLTNNGIQGGCSAYGQPSPCDLVNLIGPDGGSAYFFTPGALGAPGVYTSVTGAFDGTLTVSTPEPASMALFGTGLLGPRLPGKGRRRARG